MPSLNDVTPGSSADSSCIQQVIDALKGTAGLGIPISITAVNDAANFATDVRNQEAVNSRSFRVRNAAGGTQIQADVNGVTINQLTVSSGTLTGSTFVTPTLTGALVSTATPGMLSARLDSTTLASTTAVVTMAVTSSAYRNLELSMFLRGDDVTQSAVSLRVQVNSDTAGNYDIKRSMASTGNTFFADSSASSTDGNLGDIPGSSAPASIFGMVNVRINGYASAAQKVLQSDYSFSKANNSSANLVDGRNSVHWRSASPITSLRLSLGSGAFSSGSQFALYGRP